MSFQLYHSSLNQNSSVTPPFASTSKKDQSVEKRAQSYIPEIKEFFERFKREINALIDDNFQEWIFLLRQREFKAQEFVHSGQDKIRRFRDRAYDLIKR